MFCISIDVNVAEVHLMLFLSIESDQLHEDVRSGKESATIDDNAPSSGLKLLFYILSCTYMLFFTQFL